MMKQQIDLLSEILRTMEAEIGTRDVADTLMHALLDSVEIFRAKNSDDFCDQFRDFVYVMSQTEPKFGILNFHFANLMQGFCRQIKGKNLPEKRWKEIVLRKIKNILSEARKSEHDLVRYADKLHVDGKTILIHDHSHTVQDVLVHFKKIGRDFKVVIAEQDFEKTHGNIERMYNAKIPFQVVPAYMLSHIHKEIDMLFFGALTLKDSMDFVMDPGTHGIISEFHIEKIPAYMFINTAKFSLWKSKKKSEVFMRKHQQQHHNMPIITYERIKYSHDRVPVKLFGKIITNEGSFDPDGIKELFREKYEKYNQVFRK